MVTRVHRVSCNMTSKHHKMFGEFLQDYHQHLDLLLIVIERCHMGGLDHFGHPSLVYPRVC